MHAQRAFSHVLLRQQYFDVVASATVDVGLRCRFRQAAVTGAGRFQTCIDDGTGFLRLADDDYLVNWWLRYGLPQPHLKGRRCADSCRQFGLGSVALAPVFTSGVHSISCDSCDNAGWRLHQALVTECERFCCEELGGSASRSGIACHADDDGMVDTMITQPSRFCGTGGVDVTVVNTLAPSHCTAAAGADASHPLRAAEEEKLRRHSDQSSRAGHDYFTAVFTSLGGIHGSFFTDLVLPHFKEETARAKASGEDTWAIVRRKQRLLDRWSVVVARYNAVAIRAVGAGFGRTRRDTGPLKASSASTHTSPDHSSDDGDDVKENRPRNGGGGRLARSRAAAASDTL